MSKKNLKYILYLVFIIALLFCVSVLIVLLFKKNDTPQEVSEDDVVFVADSNTVIIKNIISVSEDFGKTIHEENGGAFGYLEFSLINKVNEEKNNQIYITKQTPTISEINSNYITFYLTDSENNTFEPYTGNKLPSYDDFHYLEDKADSKSISTGTLKAGETKNFVLRVWIADNFVITSTEEMFSFEINARAY